MRSDVCVHILLLCTHHTIVHTHLDTHTHTHTHTHTPVISPEHEWGVSLGLGGVNGVGQPLVGAAHSAGPLHPAHRHIAGHVFETQVPVVLHATPWEHQDQPLGLLENFFFYNKARESM